MEFLRAKEKFSDTIIMSHKCLLTWILLHSPALEGIHPVTNVSNFPHALPYTMGNNLLYVESLITLLYCKKKDIDKVMSTTFLTHFKKFLQQRAWENLNS